MSICWVTGAQGQVGKALQRSIESQESQNYLFLTRADLDITDLISAQKLATKYPPDCIINLAAYTDVNGAEDNFHKAYLLNSTGVKNLATIAEMHHAALIQISTDYVFDGTKSSPYVEIDKPNPLNIYGKSKLKGEEHAQNLCSKLLIVRTSWIFSEFGNNFVTTIIRLSQRQTPLRVVEDQLGGPTSAWSLATALHHLSERMIRDKTFDDWGVFHFCQKPYVSWFDLCCKTQELLASQQKVCSFAMPCSTADFPQAAERPKNSTLDCRKIERLGLLTTSWVTDLERTIDLYAPL